MHLCRTLDIILALLFASQTSAFSALLGRQFDLRRWCDLRTTLDALPLRVGSPAGAVTIQARGDIWAPTPACGTVTVV